MGVCLFNSFSNDFVLSLFNWFVLILCLYNASADNSDKSNSAKRTLSKTSQILSRNLCFFMKDPFFNNSLKTNKSLATVCGIFFSWYFTSTIQSYATEPVEATRALIQVYEAIRWSLLYPCHSRKWRESLAGVWKGPFLGKE